MSIRLRLTTWYSALLAVSLITFSLLLYFALSYFLYAETDRTLSSKAGDVLRSVMVTGHSPAVGPSLVLPDVDEFSSPGVYVQVLDAAGKVATRSQNLGRQQLPIDQATFGQALNRAEVYITVGVGQERLRTYNVPLILDDRVVGVLQIGRSLQQVEDTLISLRWVLVAGSTVVLAVAAGFGWLLAGRALRPIDHITQTARSIGISHQLDERLDYEGPRDEVGRLAGTFNDMIAQLEAAFSVQKRFAADASHELRTPLTAILGNVEVLRRAKNASRDDIEEALADIGGEAERMSRLVTDLLTLARADAGQFLELTPLALDEIVSDVYRQAKVIANGVEVSLGRLDQAVVNGNADRLKQLLLILVGNAIKYTPDGGKVMMSLAVEDEVRLSIADTGTGIPEEDLPYIFERFYRVSHARGREDGGTGLGLSIAQWIVEQHDGEIEVESTPNVGTTFTVYLPLAGEGLH
ncbi:MAG: HAMP domain-containing histidine kinase [Chloroflexi bacterium]|nr:HAMP domain-containing histidine kinase [Chloroflexota bacterium]